MFDSASQIHGLVCTANLLIIWQSVYSMVWLSALAILLHLLYFSIAHSEFVANIFYFIDIPKSSLTVFDIASCRHDESNLSLWYRIQTALGSQISVDHIKQNKKTRLNNRLFIHF